MGAAEAAETLGVSKDTLMRMIARGELRRVQKLPGPNGAWLLNRAEVEQMAEQAKAS
ncbi:MAG TPA: helix-turn-helix domain-containing protein [Streptosporangiaceae bacterium]